MCTVHSRARNVHAKATSAPPNTPSAASAPICTCGKRAIVSDGTLPTVVFAVPNEYKSGAWLTQTECANNPGSDKKSKEVPKASEVVFVADGDHVKMAPVKIGICDNDYWEITEGLTEGQEVVSGGYRAISKDLEDGKKIKRGTSDKGEAKEAK